MINTISITNFQSHKETVLDLSPGLNVIVGPSDSGKTAIIRALRWLIWNRPSGDAFRSEWGGPTSVQCLMDDKKIDIGRIKSLDNLYYHNHQNYEAFGTGVPEEITKALNIDETNLQQQLDSPFLINSSPGEVATYFNRIAHLDQIDTAVKSIQASIRKLSSDQTHYEEERAKQEEQLKEFEYLEKFEIDLEVLEQDVNQFSNLISKRDKLDEWVHMMDKLDAEIVYLEEILVNQEELVDTLLSLYEHRNQLQEDRDWLIQRINLLEDQEKEITNIKQLIVFKNAVEAILSLYDKQVGLKKELDQLYSHVDYIVSQDKSIASTKLKIEELEKKFHEEMPEFCPLCGHKYKKIEPDV
jgi:chromosome segregation ATPase